MDLFFFFGHHEETVSTLRRRSSTVSLEVHEPSEHVVGFLFLRIPVKVYLLFKNAEECVRLCLVIECTLLHTLAHRHGHGSHTLAGNGSWCVWVDGRLDVGGKVRAGCWLSLVDESVSQECVQSVGKIPSCVDPKRGVDFTEIATVFEAEPYFGGENRRIGMERSKRDWKMGMKTKKFVEKVYLIVYPHLAPFSGEAFRMQESVEVDCRRYYDHFLCAHSLYFHIFSVFSRRCTVKWIDRGAVLAPWYFKKIGVNERFALVLRLTSEQTHSSSHPVICNGKVVMVILFGRFVYWPFLEAEN